VTPTSCRSGHFQGRPSIFRWKTWKLRSSPAVRQTGGVCLQHRGPQRRVLLHGPGPAPRAEERLLPGGRGHLSTRTALTRSSSLLPNHVHSEHRLRFRLPGLRQTGGPTIIRQDPGMNGYPLGDHHDYEMTLVVGDCRCVLGAGLSLSLASGAVAADVPAIRPRGAPWPSRPPRTLPPGTRPTTQQTRGAQDRNSNPAGTSPTPACPATRRRPTSFTDDPLDLAGRIADGEEAKYGKAGPFAKQFLHFGQHELRTKSCLSCHPDGEQSNWKAASTASTATAVKSVNWDEAVDRPGGVQRGR
jgi:hypothetical protein